MRYIRLLTALLLITGLPFGCGGGGSSPTAITYQKQTPMAVVISGSVVDAAKQATGVPATITVSGATVSNLSGEALPTPFATASNGIVTFALAQLPASDLTLTITAKATGYVTNSYTFLINKSTVSTGKVFQFLLPLVSTSASTDGVSNGTAKAMAQAPLTVSAANPATGAATNVNIPAGTIASAGSSVLSGELTLTASNYDTQKEKSLALAPSDGATFITAGFTDVSVHDNSGTAATKLDKPMMIRMDIAAGTINPATNAELKKDDLITVYTYKPASGTWVPESSLTSGTGDVAVLQDGKGLYVEFTADHFSYWNLGFRRGVATCTKTITLTGPGVNQGLTLTATGLTPTTPPNLVSFYTGIKPPADTQVILQNVPKGYKMTYIFSYGNANEQVGKLDVSNEQCSPSSLSIAAPSGLGLRNYSWTVNLKCQNPYTDTPQALPNFTVYSCPPATTSLQPFPTCTIVSVTNGGGVASFSATSGYVIFIQPPDTLAALGFNNATLPDGSPPPAIITGTSSYVGLWDFCKTTGGSGGTN